MKYQYGDCYYCGGDVTEQPTRREYHWNGKLFVFENVPVGICEQCGEGVIKAKVAKKLERAVLRNERPKKRILVPVYSYLTI